MGNGAPGIEISGLAYSSQSVTPGALFFCVPGFRVDGHEFAADAVARGAAALVCQRPLGLGVPEIVVDDVRAAMGPAAARFYGDPTAQLELTGVTGTNGKTTTAYLVTAPDGGRGAPVRPAGDGQARGGGHRGGGRAHHARGHRPPAHLPAHGRRRRPGLRDGGLLARAPTRAGGRDPLRGQGVHQPHPGPPRLPRVDGGLLRGQAPVVRRAGDRRDQRGRPLRPADRRRGRLP